MINMSYFLGILHSYLLPKGQGFSVYKLDKNFSIISSKNEEHIPEIKKISLEDIKVDDKIEILPKIFLDKNLSISKFYYSDTENQKPYYNLAKSTFRIDDKLLYINGDNFIIL